MEAPLVKVLEPTLSPLPEVGSTGIIDVSARPATREEVVLNYLPGDQSVREKAVSLDSKASLTVLRPAVHRILGEGKRLPTVAEFRKTLFKDVLKVDLDDPYLGLKVDDVPGT